MAKPAPITIPTEPNRSISRPVDLIERIAKGDSEDPNPAPLYEDAIRDTIEQFEATGSPVFADGEQGSITIATLFVCMGFQSRSHSSSRPHRISRRRKKCATVLSNSARIGAGARETVNF